MKDGANDTLVNDALAGDNLRRAEQLAGQLASIELHAQGVTSSSWLGRCGRGQRWAIWANSPAHQAGTLGQQLGQELLAFLQLAEADEGLDRLVLFLDSAGVSLREGEAGMRACAAAIRALHRLNIHQPVVTVAVLGQQLGCFGGALLIAGACQYQLASPQGRYGVSGSRVIGCLSPEPVPDEPFCYSAVYRMLNSEVSALLPEGSRELFTQIAALSVRSLTLSRLQQTLEFLLQKSREDQQALTLPGLLPAGVSLADTGVQDEAEWGFSGDRSLGCEALLSLSERLLYKLEQGEALPELSGNAVQGFSTQNEVRGFSACLSLLAAIVSYASEMQGPVRVRVDRVGSGATFIALALTADELHIDAGARVYSLPPAVKRMFLGNEAGAEQVFERGK